MFFFGKADVIIIFFFELDYDQLYLLGRAKTKFDQYDVDNSGTLGTNVWKFRNVVKRRFMPNSKSATLKGKKKRKRDDFKITA